MKQFSCNKLRHSRVYFTVTVGIIEQLSCIKIENLLANTNFRSWIRNDGYVIKVVDSNFDLCTWRFGGEISIP